MNSFFQFDEDFDFSDDDSLCEDFFGQSNHTNKQIVNTGGKNESEEQQQMSNELFSNKESASLAPFACNTKQEKHHIETRLSSEPPSLHQNQFLQNGLKRKAELEISKSCDKDNSDCRKNEGNFEFIADDEDFDIPSDESFENEINFFTRNSKTGENDKHKNLDINSINTQTHTSLHPDYITPIGYRNDTDENMGPADWSLNDNHTISKRQMEQLESNIPSKRQFEKHKSFFPKNSFKTPEISSRKVSENKFRTPDSGFSSLENSGRGSNIYSSKHSHHAKIQSDSTNIHHISPSALPKENYFENDEKSGDDGSKESFNDKSTEVQFTLEKKRKFPGPAGLLPKLNSINDINNIVLPSPQSAKKLAQTPKAVLSPAILNIRDDDDFRKPLWLNLQKQARECCQGLVNHTVSTIIRKASQNRLEKGKVPLFCSLIKVFSVNGSDASIVLKDPTGEIHGTVHKRVLENYQPELCPGSGIILKQVSIFSPTAKKHYVNITPSNIILLLPAEQMTSSQASQCPIEESQRPESFQYTPKSNIIDRTENLNNSMKKETLEDLFDEEESLNSWLDDNDFLEEIPTELCN